MHDWFLVSYACRISSSCGVILDLVEFPLLIPGQLLFDHLLKNFKRL